MIRPNNCWPFSPSITSTRLNIAGPRASQEPQVAAFVRSVLVAALDRSEASRVIWTA